MIYICPKCGFEIKTSREKHTNSCNGLGPRRKLPLKGYNPWNKGLTKQTSQTIKNQTDKLKEQYRSGEKIHWWTGRKHKPETIEKLQKRTKFGIIKRSKNEIYFSELCIKYFNKVLLNEQMFNGWDADVIIEDIKIAILWNGKWHYEKIMKEHSVEQVQTRDNIKIQQIKQFGYTPYIIKDMGKHNKEFVEKEFEKLKKFIHTDVV